MQRLVQSPAPGERLLRFVGDRVRFSLRLDGGQPWPEGWRACLRTNLGRGRLQREEIIASVETGRPPTLASWRDIPLERRGQEWVLELPLAEVGYFRAKAYALEARGWQHWPEGPDAGVCVQPDAYRTANTIYCAFPRMFGRTKEASSTEDPVREQELQALDQQGYTVIPPSGKLRDLVKELPHIFGTLGCRILHLLPVNPTPTTLARFGRFGSPYACQDLLDIDPALVEFDRAATGVDQFRELTNAVHARDGRVFLDMVINHTGWGSTLQQRHPDWYVRGKDGAFVSPGAWDVTWEDLVELEHGPAPLRQYLGEVFLEWCRRGVDGFRCDAGYKVPMPVWQYITARVRQEFPDTVFLLEGLGGPWEATETLLTEGGLQWAYSELFQNYTGAQVGAYLDHAWRQSRRVGLLVHYSETHDNPRLAGRGRAWSLLRNRLCALTSVGGAFGFTCGVEWLAAERVNVHSSRGLTWGNPDNLVTELQRLNRLLADHPCFFDGAELKRLSPVDSPVFAALRVSAEGTDAVLVLVNLDPDKAHALGLEIPALAAAGLDQPPLVDLLGQPPPKCEPDDDGSLLFKLERAAAFCLAAAGQPRGLSGEAYRRRKACEAFACTVLSHHLPIERLGGLDGGRLAECVERDPAGFLSAAACLSAAPDAGPVMPALEAAAGAFPRVVTWRWPDRHRVLLVPPDHWLLVREDGPFRVTLRLHDGSRPQCLESIRVREDCVAAFAPRGAPADGELIRERLGEKGVAVVSAVRFLAPVAAWTPPPLPRAGPGLVLLTNGLGGMARLCVDLGAIRSKYDCLLAANLHPRVPVDRHVFAKRVRVWVNADGFLSPLNAGNLAAFDAGPPAHWCFLAPAGDARAAEIHLQAAMLEGRNITVLRFHRPAGAPRCGRDLPAASDVRLSVRVDIEDRNFHGETKHTGGAEYHFASHTAPLEGWRGFRFTPARDRRLRVSADAGVFHPAPEWCENIPHPVEASRGQVPEGDAFSPGWFELPLPKGATVELLVSAETEEPSAVEIAAAFAAAAGRTTRSAGRPSPERHPPGAALTGAVAEGVSSAANAERRRLPSPMPDPRLTEPLHSPVPDFALPAPPPAPLGAQLLQAARAFLVRRENARSVIAGYPWFLDWGRDSLIAARGLLAAGRTEEVLGLLQMLGRFEQAGTLPNSLHGEDASNRDSSDAPLWYGIVCEEVADREQAAHPAHVAAEVRALAPYTASVDPTRTVADVLRSIAAGYVHGTPNGIRMDPESALVWSPAHFTWMDTNHPPGTPREGYPVCIQALWIRLLRQLHRLELRPVTEPWLDLAHRAQASLDRFFWLEERGYFADVLHAPPGQPAREAVPDTALRSNGLLVVALGLSVGGRARRCVDAALRHLVVPGALRSLAPLPVSPPLAIHGPDGRLLSNPQEPYFGRYEGDEDTRRKPAYHNGTAWVWTLPAFCEAMARAWDFMPAAVAAARAYLGSVERLLQEGCIGQLPEILDGDAPHQQRGCDAQAWSVTEALRVWRLLESR
jgi:hypothetical protein